MPGQPISQLAGSSQDAGAKRPLHCILVDAGGTVVAFGSGGTSAQDRSAFVAGTTLGTPFMGVFEASPTTLADGQVGLAGLTNDRKLKISGSFSSTPITASTANKSTITSSAVNQTALAANASRLAFTLHNRADKPCYIRFGATATAADVQLMPGEKFSTKDVGVNATTQIDVIWDAAPTGNLIVWEFLA